MPRHVIVDGSNLATEGRTMPSLKQLIDAVQSFIEENPHDLITVVVDATFGHRIDPKEVPDFEEAIEHNEMVAPPAGAVGRGDAFVLAIAKKVNGTILSNDSFQEFHGEQTWLFDDGRLIGGKPVPHIGWVFVPRVPVRGPLSRKVQREARNSRGGSRDKSVVGGGRGRGAVTPVEPIAVIGSKEASQPMPVPKAPPPNVRGRGDDSPQPAAQERGGRDRSEREPQAKPVDAQSAVPSRSAMVNDLLPFLSFVEAHPVGSTVQVAIESYSSHGAYGHVGEARVYLPLRNISDPAPRSARDAVKLGDIVDLVVSALQGARRGIDVAMPAMASSVIAAAAAEAAPIKPARGRVTKKAAAEALAASAVEEAMAATEPSETASPAVDVTPVAAAPRGRKAAASKPAARSTQRSNRDAQIADDETPSDRARSRRSPRPPKDIVEPVAPVAAPAVSGRGRKPAVPAVAAAPEAVVAKPAPRGRKAAPTTQSLAPAAASSIKAAVEKKSAAPKSTSAAKPTKAAAKPSPKATSKAAVKPAKAVAKSAAAASVAAAPGPVAPKPSAAKPTTTKPASKTSKASKPTTAKPSK